MSLDTAIMTLIGIIVLALAGMIVLDLYTRESFTYDEDKDDGEAN